MADRRLHVFYSVARLLSFTKAAESLHMTQPAVTFQVRQLEEHFNTRLFDRTHNKISLTEAGKCVLIRAEKIFEIYDDLENSVRALTGEISGVLILGASTTIAEYMLPALLGDFKAKYPDVNIRLKVSNTEGIVTMVENNVIDLGVVEAPVSNKNLAVEACRTDRLVAITPPGHALAKDGKIPVHAIVDYPFILREEGSGTREVIVEYLKEAGVDPASLNVIMELGSLEALKGAVEAGIGISIISRATLVKEIKLGSLEVLDLDPPLERPFSFVHQKHKFRQRAMDELLEFARNYCETHQSAEE
ncbi:MAG: LysR family transcriptional regulator [Ectothiorhodospiraceae bacterium]|nr:LysR family transcriptional regulator [Ectothiorhodospiraceae bacterium]